MAHHHCTRGVEPMVMPDGIYHSVKEKDFLHIEDNQGWYYSIENMKYFMDDGWYVNGTYKGYYKVLPLEAWRWE
jgi:hypothetical protein